MTQDLVKDVLTFTWRIENFSMWPHKTEDAMSSPAFVVDMLDKRKFVLGLFPKGTKSSDADSITCLLCWRPREEDPEEIAINFRLSLIEADMKLLNLWSKNNQVIKKTDRLQYAKVFLISTLFENKKAFLPNDVLTLHFCIGPASVQKESHAVPIQSMNVHGTFSLAEVSSVVSDDSIPTDHCRTHFFCHTRIPVERSRVTWTIKNFDSLLKTKKRIPVSVESFLRLQSALLLFCYVSEDLNSDGSVRIDIQRKERDMTQMFVRCKVFVLDNNDVPRETQEDEHLFGEDYEVWSFPPIIKLSSLENSKHILLVDGKLSLRFEFLVSYKGEEDRYFDSIRKPHIHNRTDHLRRELAKLVGNPKFTVTLISDELELHAHKAVICSQSLVFRDMFSRDTQENRTGVVRIANIDAKTLTIMRDFMYIDSIPELEPHDAIKLYSAADEYQILQLKKECATLLKFKLSLYNVCDVLVLADRHQDSNLIRSVVNFFRIHEKDVFQSKQWNELMKDNIVLAEGIKSKMLTLH